LAKKIQELGIADQDNDWYKKNQHGTNISCQLKHFLFIYIKQAQTENNSLLGNRITPLDESPDSEVQTNKKLSNIFVLGI
jgi:hypothetical protein